MRAGTEGKTLQASVGGYTCAGVKSRNEDAFAAKLPASQSVVNYKGVVACLADGVSCSENAQLASQTSVTQFIEDYYSTPDSWSVKKSAGQVLTSLNSWLFHHGQQGDLRHNGLVTTFSGVIFKSNTAHLIHAGDSRIFLLRDGKLQQLTRDHCHKQYGKKSFLSRALGMDVHLEVDYEQVPLQEGDLFVFTSDGVHDWVTIAEMATFLDVQDCDLEASARQLVEKALASGSDDNLSCLLLRVTSLPVTDVDEIHRELTQLAIPPVMEVGNKIDRFEVERIIHSGTRSHIYQVRDLRNKKQYVLKAPSENFSDDPQYLEGFVREEWVGRRIDSPAVMKIYERPEGSPFLYHLCEYIEGQTLRQWIHDNPTPSLSRVRHLTEGMVRGVRVFQRLGMVHRDLKPENMIIRPDGCIVMIDFGTVRVDGLDEIARQLEEEVPVGSVDYIAPEYLRGEKGYHYSDIFSLGVIVYEMLTGKVPYKTSAAQQRNPQRYQEWSYLPARDIRKDIPIWLDLALQKACAQSPSKRYHAMSEFLADLSTPNEQLLSDYQGAPLLSRNPLLVWQWLSAVLFLVALVECWLLVTG